MKAKKTKIAFDLDGVIVDKPPLIPKALLERLFKGGGGKKLHYHFPHSLLGQFIRKLSHFYIFRPPIKNNISFIKEIAKNGQYELYVVSGRYSFLEKETKKWLEKRKLKGLFKKIYLNKEDEQPHIFKEKILKRIEPDIFIDDDEEIVDYLCQKIKGPRIYCFTSKEITANGSSNPFLNKLDFLFQ